jgi:hypothetical protein
MSEARSLRYLALAGAIAVAAFVFARGEGTAVLALATACAVIVPLGLSLAIGQAPPLLRRAALAVAPVSAAFSIIGWRWAVGTTVAIGTAGIHALTCALAGVLGLVRLWSRRGARFAPLDAFAIDVGLLLLPVGGIWLLASRAGVPLGGFHEPVVTFTAAHFHFAGLAAPIVIGGAGRLVAPERPRLRLYATVVVCAGVPLTAIGIATNHTVERFAAVVLASGMLAASAMLVGFASRRAWPRSRTAAVLFVVSGGSLLLTMALAATFALTSSAGRGSSLTGAIPLQTMIDLHGGGNAFGFALSGLVALALLESSDGT